MIEIGPVPECGAVYRLRMARPVPFLQTYYTAAYWVDGLLIDTGCAHTASELLHAIRQCAVEQVVNTHSHEDHIGANAGIQRTFGCPIWADAKALPILENPRLQPLQPYRRLFWGWPEPSHGEAISGWVESAHYRFQVIPSPGHSPDHICLFEPDRGWLFSGDAYIGGEDRALRQGYDIYGIIASLKRLAELPVQMIFSGSGSVRSSGRQPLLDKIAYLEELGDRIRNLRQAGLSPAEIRRRVLGKEMQISYLTLGHFSGANLIRSYLAAPAAESSVGQEAPAEPEHK